MPVIAGVDMREPRPRLGRRSILASGLALGLGINQKDQWIKPVVKSVVLPAHAVGTGCNPNEVVGTWTGTIEPDTPLENDTYMFIRFIFFPDFTFNVLESNNPNNFIDFDPSQILNRTWGKEGSVINMVNVGKYHSGTITGVLDGMGGMSFTYSTNLMPPGSSGSTTVTGSGFTEKCE